MAGDVKWLLKNDSMTLFEIFMGININHSENANEGFAWSLFMILEGILFFYLGTAL